MQTIDAIIVDDEILGRTLLANLITKNFPYIRLVGILSSVEEANELVRNTKIDLAFLDIEMPGGNGFEFLEQNKDLKIQVIFVTAYNNYALKAIKYSAIDYLMKPVDIEELKIATDNAIEKIKLLSVSKYLDVFIHNIQPSNQNNIKLAIHTLDGFEFINLNELYRCEADGKYTFCHFTTGKKIISTKNLKEFEDILPADKFLRVHHTHIINMDFVVKYVKDDGGYVILSNNEHISISKRKKDDFLKRIKLM